MAACQKQAAFSFRQSTQALVASLMVLLEKSAGEFIEELEKLILKWRKEMYQILIVEDDITIINMLSDFLKKEGFQTESANGMSQAAELLEIKDFDLVLIDISLKDGNGYGVCNAVKAKRDIPVIFVSASTDEYSVVTGLDMGADDYISKPFRPKELISRIKSVLRRYGRAQSVTEIGDIVIDMARCTVKKGENEIILSALEYKLLLIFLSNRGVLLTRNKLLSELWDIAGDYVNDNTLTVYIKRLREKIEDNPSEPKFIKTVRGMGYIME